MGEVDSAAGGRLGSGAAWYASKGWKILPVHGVVGGKCTCGKSHPEIKDAGKHPAIHAWHTEASSDPTKIASWWEQNPDYNIGVFARESGFLVIDVDPRNGGDTSFLKLEELAKGELPPTVEAITGLYAGERGIGEVRGRHLIYKCNPNEKFISNFKKVGLDGIDVKHNGYILLAPSRHFSGVNYQWKPGHSPAQIEIAEAPEELLAVIRQTTLRTSSGSSGRLKSGDWAAFGELEYAGEKVDIDKIMEEGFQEGNRAVGIYHLACALANRYGTDDVSRNFIETTFIRLNAEKINPPMHLEGPNSLLMHVHRAIDFVRDNPIIDKKWAGLSEHWRKTNGQNWAKQSQLEGVPTKSTEPRKGELGDLQEIEAELIPTTAVTNSAITSAVSGGVLRESSGHSSVGDRMSTLVRSGLSAGDAISGGNMQLPEDQDALDAEDGGTPGNRSFTDVGNSRRLVDTYNSAIRYTAGLGWYYWEGNYWKHDRENLELQELAKRIAPVIAGEVSNYDIQDPKINELINWAKQAKSNTRIANMIKSAVSDKRIVVPVENWDGDTHLLGVSNGVVDLRSGELLTGRPDLYITRRAPVAYNPGLRNVRFEQFLDFATKGDKEFQDWLQRAVGYTLTGLNNQDALFLVYGPPGSGKTTFVETIVNALGTQGYAWTLDPSVLAAGDGQANRTDEYHMAELRGRRMIWVDELPESERLKENQVKKMTGSGTLQGRSPGERPFQFTSQGKLWITTNHRPIINDDAMWRRLRPIPLTSIPENPDTELRPYLSDPDGGLPAVLAWAVDGAIKYLNSSAKDPLGWCSVVRDAAEIYRKNEDRIGLFFEEETKKSEGASILMTDLYSLYRQWSDKRGERAMTQIAFHRKIDDRAMGLTGQGAKAVLHGYSTPPRLVAEPEVINWSDMARHSSNAFQ